MLTTSRSIEGSRPRPAVLAAVVLALAAAACSPESAPEEAAGAGEPADSQAASADGDAGEPQHGGRLVVGIADESALGFDPSTSAVSAGGASIALAIYDTLAAFDEDGNAVPYLADSIESNEDSTEWTVTMRPGVTFHDGTPVDAAAVKATFDANDAAGRPLEEGYTTEVVEELTVVFTFPEPYGTFVAAMATQFAWIKSPTAEEELGEEFTNNPVGAGPYQFQNWVRDDHLTLVRYEDYWRDDVAFLDEVEFRVIPDNSVRRAALAAGDLDAIVVGGRDIAALRDGDFALYEESAGVDAVILNNSIAPFDDVRVRRGLAHALDTESIIDAVWDGVGTPATGPIPGDNPFYAGPDGYPTYDPEEATRLLEEYEAETGGPASFTLTFENTPTSQELAQLYQSYWQAAGADVELAAPVDTTDLLNIVATHEYEAALYEIEGFLDPDIWNYYLFHSSSFLNLGALEHEGVDAALDAGHQETDREARAQAYATYQQELADEMPWLFVRDKIVATATQPNVHGLDSWTLPDGSPGISKQFWLPFKVESLWVDS